MRVEQPEKPARPAKQHAMHRRVRVLLWSVVLAFVIVVCVDRIETGMLVNHARVSPEAVDLIGRHRTHSQHVVLHALLLASKPGDQHQVRLLADALEEFDGDTARLDALLSDAQGRLLGASLPALDQEFLKAREQLGDAARHILRAEGHIEHVQDGHPWHEFMHEVSHAYLDVTQTIMDQWRAQSARSLGWVDQIGSWLLGIEIAVACLVLLLIFEPTVRWIRRHESDLAAQREELQRLAAVAQRTTNAVIITDEKRCITWVNEAFTRMTGYTMEEVRGRVPGHILQSAKTDPATIRDISIALSKSLHYQGEIFNHGKDGREYWLSVDIQPTVDADGRHNGFMAVETDITETKRAQLEQQRVTEELTGFFESSLELLCIFDFDGRFLKANGVWSELLGVGSEELRLRAIVEFVHPEDILETERHLDALIRGQKVEGYRNRIRTANGCWRTLEWRSRSNSGLIYGAARDITDRLDMERALLQQAEQTELALASGDLGTWDWDIAGNTVRFDRRYAEMVGETIESIGNTTAAWSNRVHPDDIDQAMQRLMDCVHHGTPYQDVQFRMKHTDGTWRWIRATGKAVAWNPKGEPTRMVGTHVDVTDRVLREIERNEASHRMGLALQAGRMGLWDWDLETGKAAYDQRWAEILGEAADELLPDASTLLSRVHPEDLEQIETAIQQHLNGTIEQVAVESRLKTRNGSWRWVRLFGQKYKRMTSDESGRIVGILMDVHDQVIARAELARRETVLANTVRMAGIGGWELDLQSGVLHWSDQVRAIHQVEPDYVPILKTALEFYPSEARELVMKSVDDAIHHAKPYDIECPFITAKRKRIWVRSVCEPVLENGRVVRLVGAFQDVTEQRTQREALEASNLMLEVAQSIARMGSWSFNADTGKVTWSRQLFEIFEWPIEHGEPCYAQVLESYSRADANRLDRAVQKALDDGTPYALTLERANPTNGIRYVAIEGRARTDQNGRTTGLYGTVRDITAEVEREAALREAQLRAEDASRSKSEFLANMSHEIRTPMTAIMGFTDLLEDADGDPTLRADYVHTIRRNGEHLLTIINDILDISKIEAGKVNLERIETSPHDILSAVTQLMRVHADAKNLPIIVEATTPIPKRITTDPTRFRQILVNLIGNAIKFTQQGHVKISMACIMEHGRHILRINVEDTGIGMTPRQAEDAFDPFMQADASVTRRFGGTGLGLPISKRLAQMLGGDITLTSTPGIGSTFTLTIDTGPIEGIPMLDARDLVAETSREQTPATRSLAKSKPLQGLRLLLMEDGPDNLRLITTHLKACGASVDAARDGKQGLALLTIDGQIESPLRDPMPYDAILTDMQMPEMDGYTAVRLLRAKGCRLPIIALTAHAMTGDREKCIEAGCDAYATKPVTRQALVSIVLDTIPASTST